MVRPPHGHKHLLENIFTFSFVARYGAGGRVLRRQLYHLTGSFRLRYHLHNYMQFVAKRFILEFIFFGYSVLRGNEYECYSDLLLLRLDCLRA